MSWVNCEFSPIQGYYTAKTRYESAKPFGYCKPIDSREGRYYGRGERNSGWKPSPKENERPLNGSDSQRRKWHMRLVRNSDDSFSCWFYHQEMVRYFPPESDGSWRALTVTGCTSGDKQFMNLVAPHGFNTGDGYLSFTERTDRYVSDSDYGETKVVQGNRGYDMIEVGYDCTKNNYWVNMKDTVPFLRYGVKTDRAIAAPIQQKYRFKEFEEFLHVCRLHGNYRPIQRIFGQPPYEDNRGRLYKLKQSHPYMQDMKLMAHLCDETKWGKLVRYMEWQGGQYRQLKERVLAPAVTQTATTMLFAPSRKVARRWA